MDPAARGILIKPAGRARYVLPRVPIDGPPWRHHVTVEAERHYVDALTGVDGTSTTAYFQQHWKYPEPELYEVSGIDLTEPVT